jgi:hypothetical protein
MIEASQVRELVNEHVVAHPGRHHHEPPVQADIAASPTRSPTAALVSDTDARDGQPQLVRKLFQSRGQFRACSPREHPTRVSGENSIRQARTLSFDPPPISCDERVGFPPGSTSWNGDS